MTNMVKWNTSEKNDTESVKGMVRSEGDKLNHEDCAKWTSLTAVRKYPLLGRDPGQH